jgi:hypothetical protein
LGKSVSKCISSLLEGGLLQLDHCGARAVGDKLSSAVNGVVARMLDQMVPGAQEIGFGDGKLGG